ncbi:MAG: hypothetical protein HY852_05280 [Bradyrhizobium sp.]|uniref:hypothetical protein n=1 Tax=Bradyrhizobium sp. TaxID=376 RepID=UPI0025C2005B|nr:hypothetical protein [Bradyrhizobium sp.]MBI5261215.1 hypothetical protein [Bradyrhizobium sp.]
MRDASKLVLSASRIRSRAFAVLVLAACAMLGGCAGNNASSSSFAMAPASGPTIAFESIDGPPPHVFDRMVSVLDTESKLRSLVIVSREGTAAYRVREYLSAQVIRGRSVIAWVWDVYDQNQERALRLSGEEPTGKPAGRDPWAAADDLVLRKIAQAGFSGLSNMINGTPQDAPAPAPGLGRRGPTVAGADLPSVEREIPVAALGYAEQ